MGHLWNQAACEAWRGALESYPAVIERSGGARLSGLDRWYREELPRRLRQRDQVYVTIGELAEIVAWKMHRGEYRARNLALVRQNDPADVENASREAFALAPHPTRAISRLAKLGGVGPATASAVLAAYRPDVYPFFDELVAAQIPDFGRVKFTLKEYAQYSDRLRERSALLAVGCPTDGWTPDDVGRALWAAAGGKPGR